MTIKGRLLSSTAIAKRFQTEKLCSVYTSDRLPSTLEFRNRVWYGKTRVTALPGREKVCFDIIAACDEQTHTLRMTAKTALCRASCG